ncbi:MAG: TIGR00282 family metallophosphoesterase [Actinomycetota bacterium]
MFRLLFVGDVVGEGGCEAVRALVPGLRRELALDAVIANAENSAGGFGITEQTGEALLSVVDFLTLGDHAFDREGAAEYLERERRVVRPANLRGDPPGRGWSVFEASGVRVGVANVQGRVFMRDASSPFEAADRAVEELERAEAEAILVDLHAEATSEKQAMGWHLAGRVAAVVGTHTHVPTADVRVLPGGTAYVTDVGMTGGDGVIGFDREGWLDFFLRDRPLRPEPAAGSVRLDAVLVEIEGRRAVGARRVSRERQA